MMIKVGFYEVCISYIISCLLFYFMTILTTCFTHQICGISLIKGKEFRKHWPKLLYLEEEKNQYKW